MLKAFCAALSLFVLANTPIQETILELNSADVCCSVLDNQPLKQYASALCSIPIKIMSAILNETTASQSKHGQNHKKDNRKNSSSDYSLLAKSSGSETQNNLKFQSKVLNEVLPVFNVLNAADPGGADNPPGPPIEIIMFMLLLFVILPRSGISEGAVFLRLNR